MTHDAASQLFRPYLPIWLRERIGAPDLQPGRVHTSDATILYADLRGFTRLAAAFAALPDGAERLHDSLTRHFEALVSAVIANGGDIVAIAGDALTAWWPDILDLELGRRCGAAMQAALAAQPLIVTPEGAFQLELRIGVSAGCVHVALTGLPSHGIHLSVFGPAIAAASAAERLASPGDIHIASAVPRAPAQPTPVPVAPGEGDTLSYEHFLAPAFVERLRLNALVPEYRRCVPVFCAFELPRQPSDLHRLVAQVQTVTARWGGWLNEVEVGDKGAVFVLLFGAPIARGDDASRAVGCCLELRDRGLIRGAGITVGTLFVGPVGSPQRRVYTAQGDDMNLAAHLMQRADPGEVIVSGRVRHDILGRYRTSPPELVVTKGHAEGVPAARVLASSPGRGLPPGYLPGAVSLIGREAERRALAIAADAATRGRPQLLLLEGESGIGKSSLLHDLLASWASRDLRAVIGECSSGGHATALLAWRGVLLELCGVDESIAPRAQRAQLGHALRGVAETAGEQALAQLLGLSPADGRALRVDLAEEERALGLAAAIIARQVAAGPLLIVIEDAHWADPLSIRLAAALLAAAPPQLGYPLYLALSHRPLDADTNGLAGLRARAEATRLTLGPLSSRDSQTLMRALLGVAHVQPSLVQQVERHTEGQPLFIKEYLRVLRQSDLVQIEDDTARLTRPVVAVALASSAQGIIQARVDRLDESTRLTLKTAAVVGRSFPLRLLAAIHPAQPGIMRLRVQLDLLAELQIVDLTLGDPDRVYRFKYGIAHEVAYTSLLFGQRRQLHRAVAGWYEREYADEIARGATAMAVYDLLIDHLRRAEEWERAAGHCRRAAEQATRGHASAAVARYVEPGLVLTGDDHQRADLLLLRVAASERIGDQSGQADDLSALEQLAAQLGDPLRGAYAAVFQMRYLLAMGMAQVVFDLTPGLATQLRRARRGGGRDLALLLRAALLDARGSALAALGDDTGALALHRRALDTCRAVQSAPGLAAPGEPPRVLEAQGLAARCLENLGAALARLGSPARALRCHQRAQKLARATGDWYSESRSRVGAAQVLRARGRPAEAEDQAEAALATSHAVGDRGGQALALRELAALSAGRGDYSEAQRRAWHALAICTGARLRALELGLLDDLAGFADAQGLGDEAEAVRQEATRARQQWWGGAGRELARG